MQASSTLPPRTPLVPAPDVSRPLPARDGKIINLLIILEALRADSHALGAQKV